MQVHELGVTEENKEKAALTSSFNLFSQTKIKLPFECHCRRANNVAFMFQGSSLLIIPSFQLQLRKAVVPIISLPSKSWLPCCCLIDFLQCFRWCFRNSWLWGYVPVVRENGAILWGLYEIMPSGLWFPTSGPQGEIWTPGQELNKNHGSVLLSKKAFLDYIWKYTLPPDQNTVFSLPLRMDLAFCGGYPADFPGFPIVSYVYTKEEIKTNAHLSSALTMVSSGRQTQPKQQKE